MRSPRSWRSTLMRATASASAERSEASTADVGPGHRRQHREAAVAGAQVEHARAVGPCSQASMRAVGQHLGDQRARHDAALVDVERHALQPGLAGQVGGRLAGVDALVDECVDAGDLLVVPARARPRRPARPAAARAPQHQPGRFVEGVGRAVAKRNARLFEAGACALDSSIRVIVNRSVPACVR